MKSVRDAEHKPNRQNFYGWKKTAGMQIGGRAGEREGATRRCRDESGPVRVHEGGALWRWLVLVPSCAVLPGLGVGGRGILCREGSAERNRRARASDYVSILLTSQSNSKSCEDNKPISRGASGRPRGGMNRKRSKQRGPHRIGAEAGLCLFRVLCFLFPCFLVALLLRIVDDCSIDWLRCSHPLPPILFTSARGGVRPFRLVFVVLCIEI